MFSEVGTGMGVICTSLKLEFEYFGYNNADLKAGVHF